MSLFGFMVLRQLTDEQQAELDALLASFNAPSVVVLPEPPASAPLPESQPGNLLQGVITWGDIAVEWRDGVPLRAWRVSRPDIGAAVPYRFWQAVMANAPRDEWLHYVYLAAPESWYVEDAHNPTGEDSWGALQVNRDAWPQYSAAELSTYDGNVRAAVAIRNVQGWGAWWNSARLIGLIA